MIISLDRINDFLIKHKKRDERGSQGLWAMADQKDALAARLNSDITTRSHYFGERKSFYLDEKLISIYREWIDRLVDFCLYRHLTDLSHKNNWVSPNYMSTKGKGRFFAIRELYFNVPQYPFVFKTDIKSYYANIDTHILEKLIFKMGLPKSLQNLIAQDLFSSLDIR